MTNLLENYEPEIQQDGLNTNKLAIFGATLSAVKLVVPAVSGTNTIAIDLSAVLGSQRAISFTATGDTPVAISAGSVLNTGWLKVDVAGTARYIPFYR